MVWIGARACLAGALGVFRLLGPNVGPQANVDHGLATYAFSKEGLMQGDDAHRSATLCANARLDALGVEIVLLADGLVLYYLSTHRRCVQRAREELEKIVFSTLFAPS